MDSASSACDWNSALFLIFSDNVVPLTYYTHLLPLIVSLLLGVFILVHNRRALVNWVLFFITMMFSVWVYFDLILWASPSPEHIMFFWSSIVPIEMLIYASCLYLLYVFANGLRDISLSHKIALAVFFIPIVLFTHTSYNVLGLSPDCDVGAIEGPLIQYMYLVEVIFIGWAIFIVARNFHRLKDSQQRLQFLLIGIGTIFFLIFFTLGNITLVFSLPPDYEQYKLFGMPILAAFIAYSIVRFKSFNAKILTSEVLVVALAIATISLLFLQHLKDVRLVAGLTFVLVCVLGYILVRNVHREIEQREHIEMLAKSLEQANERLKELNKLKSQFLSIASHDLKAPLTTIRNFMSLLMEGTYGKLPVAADEGARKVFDTATEMVKSVDNYLNVSRIEQGKIKYDFVEADLVKVVSETTSQFKPLAEKKRLAFTFRGPADLKPIPVKADIPKLHEVFSLLIDNSIKYTPQGSITVSVESAGKVARVTVKDTGIGITKETMPKLFQLFSTAEDSRKINTSSAGVGLYVVKAHVEAHQGKVWAESEGAGKGSSFVVELPVLSKDEFSSHIPG